MLGLKSDSIADAIIDLVGNDIVLALPLGLGKANTIANALTQRACDDKNVQLQIITALTLELPPPGSMLQRRFWQPANSRLFGDYPALLYAQLIRNNALPENIQVSEFFVAAGKWLHSGYAQQHFIPANYTHAMSYLLDRGVNVVAQLLATEESAAGSSYSLSCNTDITVDLLRQRQQGKADFIFAGQIASELPFMASDALVSATEIDLLLQEEESDFELFAIPKRPVSIQDQAIGIQLARLVRDGGTLQIGIGAIGDAVTRALILRHRENTVFRELVATLDSHEDNIQLEDQPFAQGVYGLSEMFVDGFLHLAEQGILKREVDGAILHAGFFLDCRDFYRKLREMPAPQRAQLQMKPVSFTNQLYGQEAEKRAARVKATFINSAMMVTLRGAVISDALEDGSVVSGVGGQYNFVAQAFALEDARAIICLNATRQSKGKVVSNIVWSYGHETVPWHLRDIIMTEYGYACLRGKTESEAIQAMLSITDSRFQEALLKQAQAAGKLDSRWRLPAEYRNNLPAKILTALQPARERGVLPQFPFGTDFTETEQRLMDALSILEEKRHSRLALAQLFLRGLFGNSLTPSESQCQARMGFDKAGTIEEKLYKYLLNGALLRSR